MQTLTEKKFLEEFYNTKGHGWRKDKTSGRYLVYVYDESYKNHRKLLSKPTKQALDKAVIQHYHANESTFEDLYFDYYSLRFGNENNSTRDRWDCTWNTYFSNTSFIQKPISQYSLGDIEDFVYPIVNKKMTHKQAQKILNILKEVFHRSVSKDYRVNNPMNEFSIPESYFVREYEREVEESVLNSFEFKLIQKELFREIVDFPKYSTAFAILLDAFTGARAGEVVAWKWSDISFKKGTISIRRAESRHSKRNEQGEKIKGFDYIIGDVKTKNSRRNLPLSKNALKVLRLLKDWQTEHNLDTDWLFVNTDGQRITASILEQKYRRLWKRLDLESGNGGIHCLRKTFCTELAKKGMSIYELQKLMGHSDIATTQKYYIKIDLDKENSLQYLEAL